MIFTWLLSNWRLVLFGILLAALGLQTVRLNNSQAEFAKFRADVDRIASEAKVRNAQEAAQQALNSSKALDDLQARYSSLNASYRVLRDKSRSGGVPRLSDAAKSISACPGNPEQPDSAARLMEQVEAGVLAVLEGGDKELNKYAELWKLEQQNAAK